MKAICKRGHEGRVVSAPEEFSRPHSQCPDLLQALPRLQGCKSGSATSNTRGASDPPRIRQMPANTPAHTSRAITRNGTAS